MNAEVKVKGTAIKSTLNFILKKYGNEGLNKIREALDENEREILSPVFIYAKWYPAEVLIKLTQSVVDIFNQGDENIAFEMGKFSAEEGLNIIYKAFYKLGSPQFIMRKAAPIYSTYFSVGKFIVTSSTSASATARLEGFPCPPYHRLIELRILGWMHRSIELSGGKNINSAITKSVLKGDAYTEFTGEWEL